MTPRLWVILIVVVVVALLAGLVTPDQLGVWVSRAAAWAVDVGRALVEGARDLLTG